MQQIRRANKSEIAGMIMETTTDPTFTFWRKTWNYVKNLNLTLEYLATLSQTSHFSMRLLLIQILLKTASQLPKGHIPFSGSQKETNSAVSAVCPVTKKHGQTSIDSI